MAENISERNLSLAESTRAVVSSLSLRDQITFWQIADSDKGGGMNAKGIVLSTNESIAGVNRSIKRLKKHGLIAREGSKKTGRYVLVGDAHQGVSRQTKPIFMTSQNRQPFPQDLIGDFKFWAAIDEQGLLSTQSMLPSPNAYGMEDGRWQGIPSLFLLV